MPVFPILFAITAVGLIACLACIFVERSKNREKRETAKKLRELLDYRQKVMGVLSNYFRKEFDGDTDWNTIGQFAHIERLFREFDLLLVDEKWADAVAKLEEGIAEAVQLHNSIDAISRYDVKFYAEASEQAAMDALARDAWKE